MSFYSPKVWSVYWSPATPNFPLGFGAGVVWGSGMVPGKGWSPQCTAGKVPKTALPAGPWASLLPPTPHSYTGLSILLLLQELMERLQGIVTRPQHLRPAQNSKVQGQCKGWAWGVSGLERWVGLRGGWAAAKTATSPPAPVAQITSDYRAEFARCLEPLLLLGPHQVTGAGSSTNM